MICGLCAMNRHAECTGLLRASYDFCACADRQHQESRLNVSVTLSELQVLIAILQFAEGAAPALNPALIQAMEFLKPFRAQLVDGYVLEVLARG